MGGGRSGTRKFFGIGDDGKSFVYVVDRSTSMLGGNFERLKEELISAINMLTREHTFHVIFYSDTHEPMPGGMTKARDRAKEKAREWIESMFPVGGTYPAEALSEAIKEGPDAVFFMTDGQIPPDTPEAVRQANPKKRVRVHTIGFGGGADAAILEVIAEENRGVFRHVRDGP